MHPRVALFETSGFTKIRLGVSMNLASGAVSGSIACFSSATFTALGGFNFVSSVDLDTFDNTSAKTFTRVYDIPCERIQVNIDNGTLSTNNPVTVVLWGITN
jgi:hypothetical protein